MSIVTIYKCDKCGCEQHTSDQFWTVGIIADHFQYSSRRNFVKDMNIQVCRPCLESFGIHVMTKPEPEHRKPTVEDLIGEIISLYKENQ